MMSSLRQNEFYQRRPGTAQISGQLYESKILALFNFRLIKRFEAGKIQWFQIATNIAGIGNFDDIVVRICHSNGALEYIFVQAKHRQGKSSETFKEIFKKNGDFSLRVNFKNYLEVMEKFNSPENDGFFNADLKNVKLKFVFFSSSCLIIRKNQKFKNLCVDKKDLLWTYKGKKCNFMKYSSIIVPQLLQNVREQCRGMFDNEKAFQSAAEDFLKRFWIYSNQANQEEVGKILTQEIFTVDKICNDQLLFDEFHIKIQDYWKDNQKKVKYLDQTCNILEHTRQFITLCVLSQTFETKVLEFDLEFTNDAISSDLNQLLQTDGERVVNLYSEAPLITGIKLAQHFHQKSSKSCCVIEASTIGKNFNIFTAFGNAKQFDTLVIIDCNATHIRFQNTENISNKKVIIVSNENHPNSITDSHINLYNLSVDCQNRLLKSMQVTCRGNTFPLHEVFGNGVNFSQDLKRSIDSELLLTIIDQKPVELIPRSLSDDLNVTNYYVNRKVTQHLIDRQKLDNYCKSEADQICVVRKFNNNLKQRVIVAVSKTRDLFLKFCNFYEDRTVYWVSEADDDFIWQESFEKRHPYDFLLKKTYEVNSLNDLDERVLILSAEPGMGKSTLLTQFTASIGIIRINLLEFYSHFDEMNKSNLNLVMVLKFLLQNGFKIQDNVRLEMQEDLRYDKSLRGLTLLKTAIFVSLYNTKQLSVLIDGFDEIVPKYGKPVLDFLNVLKNSDIRKLIVTTRSNSAQKELQNGLVVPIKTLEPFSDDQIFQYFVNRWGTSSEFPDLKKVKAFISELVSYYSNIVWLSDNKHFLGIPLHAEMVCTCFEEIFKQFYNDQTGIKPSRLIKNEQLDLVSLYEKFIKIKQIVYLKDKCELDIKHPNFDDRDYTDKFELQHGHLALVTLFEDDILEEFFPCSEPSKYRESLDLKVEKEGVVCKIDNGNPMFVHLSYAEYYAAKILFEKIMSLSHNDFELFWLSFVMGDLVENDRRQVCKFLQTLALRSSNRKNFVPNALVILKTCYVTDLENISFQYLLGFLEIAMPYNNSQQIFEILKQKDHFFVTRFFYAVITMKYPQLV